MRCPATVDQRIRCEQAPGHTGRHTNGLLGWWDPPRLVIGDDQHEPDLTTNTDHWVNGQVVFSKGFAA